MEFLNSSIIQLPTAPIAEPPAEPQLSVNSQAAASSADTFDPLYDGTFDYAENAAIRNDEESAVPIETVGCVSLVEEMSQEPRAEEKEEESVIVSTATAAPEPPAAPLRATVQLPFLTQKNTLQYTQPAATLQYNQPGPTTLQYNAFQPPHQNESNRLLADLSKQISKSLTQAPVLIDGDESTNKVVEDEIRQSLQTEFDRAEPTLKKVYEAVQNDEKITDPSIMENVRKDFCSFMFDNPTSEPRSGASDGLKTRYNELGRMFEKINVGGGSSIAAIIDSIITSIVGDNIPAKDMNIMTIFALITNYVYATIFEKFGAEPEAEDLAVLNKITSMLFYEVLNDRVKSILSKADCDTGQKTTRIYLLVVACVPLLIKIAKTCKSRPKPYPPIQQQQQTYIQPQQFPPQQQQLRNNNPYYNDDVIMMPPPMISVRSRSSRRFQNHPYRNGPPSHSGVFHATRVAAQNARLII